MKGIPLTYTYIHLLKNEHHSPEYTSANPSASVPTLIYTSPDGSKNTITQSVAILEFLEECFPTKFPLLPPSTDIVARANVRTLVNVIACDVQPVTNLRTLQQVKDLGSDQAKWAKECMTRGLQAFDVLGKRFGGKYSVGDKITMADVLLVPAVDGALRYGVEVEKMERVWKVYCELKEEPAFVKGGWRSQEDTPEEFRVHP